jgi:hypothetical protein
VRLPHSAQPSKVLDYALTQGGISRSLAVLSETLPRLSHRKESGRQFVLLRQVFRKYGRAAPQAHHHGRLSVLNLRLFSSHVQERVLAPYSDGLFYVS